MPAFALDTLAAIIAGRAAALADNSYTRSLLDKGLTHTARKFTEEAVELLIAAVENDKAAMKMEAADVLYHLLVVLQAGGVSLQDVVGELERRTSRSGHAEKAAR